METTLKAEIGGKTLSIQTGKIAKQASGSVVVRYGDTIVLVTTVSAHKERPSSFLPLSVEYQEKIYAAGRIPGNYFRREIGRPSEKETLTARLIDRPIRPLFPKKYSYETQVIATVLSMDQENDPDTLAMIGASTALTISDIPFAGPIASVRVGRVNGQLMINPGISDWEESDLNIIVAGSKTGVVMVEGGGNLISEADMLEAIFFAHDAMQPLIDIQVQLQETHGAAKRPYSPPAKDEDLVGLLEPQASAPIREAILIPEKTKRSGALRELKAQLFENLGEAHADRGEEVYNILDDLQKKISRDLILKEGRRIDARRFDEIRPISCETGILPRPHGSALFTRGETQVLGVLTLGSGQDEQRVETLGGEELRPFMLHYNFPPYSVGEVKRIGGPSRRDIGHGGLSTRAIEKILPDKENFDYTIRLVSEVFESNGSSSMGTVCSCCLALMDGGVPIKAPVAGIAMGLVKEDDQIVILSDILGDEDHTGDMDFKVAGTREGITALQMDIKILELSKDIMEKALAQAKAGRLHILDKMAEALSKPRQEISPYAPTISTIQIHPDKIREVIGPGGKIIRGIQSETNTSIAIEDSGVVKVAAISKEEGDAAIKMIEDLTKEPEVGTVYEGTVVKIMDFGAFVQIMPGTDGLVHISQLAHHRVTKVSDIVKEGDKLKVKVLEISRDGKIRLSHKAVLEEEKKVTVDKTSLKNGIRIVSKKMPHARSVSMGVWVNVGARDESELESGLSHFIEHMIFKGTRKRSAFQIAKEFDAIGGHTNAFTAMENTCYHARVMDTHTETMVEILSDIFINSVFDPVEIDKERPVILQEIGMVEDSPEEYVHLLSGNNFWGKIHWADRFSGSPQNIIQFDAQMIKKFFHRLYQPERIVISAAGNLDHNRLVDLVQPAFETIKPGNGFPQRITPQSCSLIDLTHRDLEQMHICLSAKGLSITDPRRYTFSLLNTILGGNMSSRLFQEVREKRGLAYSVYSFISSHGDTGMFGVYVGVAPKRAQETTRLVLNEIHRLRKERVESSELKGALEYTKGGLLLASESIDNQMVRSAQNEIHFGCEIRLQEIIEKVEAVTRDDILELANDLFHPRQMALTLLGPVNNDKKEFEEILFDPDRT